MDLKHEEDVGKTTETTEDIPNTTDATKDKETDDVIDQSRGYTGNNQSQIKIPEEATPAIHVSENDNQPTDQDIFYEVSDEHQVYDSDVQTQETSVGNQDQQPSDIQECSNSTNDLTLISGKVSPIGEPRTKHDIESTCLDVVDGLPPSAAKSRSLSMLPSIEESNEEDLENAQLFQHTSPSTSFSLSSLPSSTNSLFGHVVQGVSSKPTLTAIQEEIRGSSDDVMEQVGDDMTNDAADAEVRMIAPLKNVKLSNCTLSEDAAAHNTEVEPTINSKDGALPFIESNKGHGDAPMDDPFIDINSKMIENQSYCPGGEGCLEDKTKIDFDLMPQPNIIVNVLIHEMIDNIPHHENVGEGEILDPAEFKAESERDPNEKPSAGQECADTEDNNQDNLVCHKVEDTVQKRKPEDSRIERQTTGDCVMKDSQTVELTTGDSGAQFTLTPSHGECEDIPKTTGYNAGDDKQIESESKSPSLSESTAISGDDEIDTEEIKNAEQSPVGEYVMDPTRCSENRQPNDVKRVCLDDEVDEAKETNPEDADDEKKPTTYSKAKGSGSDSKVNDTTSSGCDVNSTRESHSEHTLSSANSDKQDKEGNEKDSQKQRDKDKDRDGNKRKRDRGAEEGSAQVELKGCLKNAVGDVCDKVSSNKNLSSGPYICEIMGSEPKTTCRLEWQLADVANDSQSGENQMDRRIQQISEISHNSAQDSDSISDSLKQNKPRSIQHHKSNQKKKHISMDVPTKSNDCHSPIPASNEAETDTLDICDSSNGVDSSLSDDRVSSEASEHATQNGPLTSTQRMSLFHETDNSNAMPEEPADDSDAQYRANFIEHDNIKQKSYDGKCPLGNEACSELDTENASVFETANTDLYSVFGQEHETFITADDMSTYDARSTSRTISIRNETSAGVENTHTDNEIGGNQRSENDDPLSQDTQREETTEKEEEENPKSGDSLKTQAEGGIDPMNSDARDTQERGQSPPSVQQNIPPLGNQPLTSITCQASIDPNKDSTKQNIPEDDDQNVCGKDKQNVCGEQTILRKSEQVATEGEHNVCGEGEHNVCGGKQDVCGGGAENVCAEEIRVFQQGKQCISQDDEQGKGSGEHNACREVEPNDWMDSQGHAERDVCQSACEDCQPHACGDDKSNDCGKVEEDTSGQSHDNVCIAQTCDEIVNGDCGGSERRLGDQSLCKGDENESNGESKNDHQRAESENDDYRKGDTAGCAEAEGCEHDKQVGHLCEEQPECAGDVKGEVGGRKVPVESENGMCGDDVTSLRAEECDNNCENIGESNAFEKTGIHTDKEGEKSVRSDEIDEKGLNNMRGEDDNNVYEGSEDNALRNDEGTKCEIGGERVVCEVSECIIRGEHEYEIPGDNEVGRQGVKDEEYGCNKHVDTECSGRDSAVDGECGVGVCGEHEHCVDVDKDSECGKDVDEDGEHENVSVGESQEVKCDIDEHKSEVIVNGTLISNACNNVESNVDSGEEIEAAVCTERHKTGICGSDVDKKCEEVERHAKIDGDECGERGSDSSCEQEQIQYGTCVDSKIHEDKAYMETEDMDCEKGEEGARTGIADNGCEENEDNVCKGKEDNVCEENEDNVCKGKEDNVCEGKEDNVCEGIEDNVCEEHKDNVCAGTKDAVCTEHVCVGNEDNICAEKGDYACEGNEHNICEGNKDNVCEGNDENMCVKNEDNVCAVNEDNACEGQEDNLCAENKDAVCADRGDDVCAGNEDHVCAENECKGNEGNICEVHEDDVCAGKEDNTCEVNEDNVCEGNEDNVCEGNEDNVCEGNEDTVCAENEDSACEGNEDNACAEKEHNVCAREEDNVCAGNEDNVCEGKEDNVCAGNENNVCEGNEDNVCAGNEDNVCAGNEDNIYEGNEDNVCEGKEDNVCSGNENNVCEGNEDNVCEGNEDTVCAENEDSACEGNEDNACAEKEHNVCAREEDNVCAGNEDNVCEGKEDNVCAGNENNVCEGNEDNVCAGNEDNVCAGNEDNIYEGNEDNVCEGKEDNVCSGNENNVCEGNEDNVCAGEEDNICEGNEDNVCEGKEDNVCAGNEDNVCAGNEDNVCAGEEDNVCAGNEDSVCEGNEDMVCEGEEDNVCEGKGDTVCEEIEDKVCAEKEDNVCEGKEDNICEGMEDTVCEGNEDNICEGHEDNVCVGNEDTVCEGNEDNVCEGKEDNVCEANKDNVCEGKEDNLRVDHEDTVCAGSKDDVCADHEDDVCAENEDNVCEDHENNQCEGKQGNKCEDHEDHVCSGNEDNICKGNEDNVCERYNDNICEGTEDNTCNRNEDNLCEVNEDIAGRGSEDDMCARNEDNECEEKEDNVSVEHEGNVCVGKEDAECSGDEKNVCSKHEDNVCLGSKDNICAGSEEIICVRNGENVCAEHEDNMCARNEDNLTHDSVEDDVPVQSGEDVSNVAENIVCEDHEDNTCEEVKDRLGQKGEDILCDTTGAVEQKGIFDLVCEKGSDDSFEGLVAKDVCGNDEDDKGNVCKELEDETNRNIEDDVSKDSKDNINEEAEDKVCKQCDDEPRENAEDGVCKELEDSVNEETEDGVCKELEDNVNDETEDGVCKELEDKVNEEIEDGVCKELADNVNEEIEDGVCKELADNVNEETEDGVCKELEDNVNDETEDGVCKELEDKVNEEIEDGVCKELADNVNEETEDGVCKELEDNVNEETDDGVCKELEDNVNEETEDGVCKELEDNVNEETEDGVCKELEDNVNEETEDGVCKELEDNVNEETEDGVCKELEDNVNEETEDGVCKELEDNVNEEIEDGVCKELADNVNEETEDGVCKELEDNVNEETDDGVCKELEDNVNEETEDGVCKELEDNVSEETEDGVCKELEDNVNEETEDGVCKELEDNVNEETDDGVCKESDDHVHRDAEDGICKVLEDKVNEETKDSVCKERDDNEHGDVVDCVYTELKDGVNGDAKAGICKELEEIEDDLKKYENDRCKEFEDEANENEVCGELKDDVNREVEDGGCKELDDDVSGEVGDNICEELEGDVNGEFNDGVSQELEDNTNGDTEDGVFHVLVDNIDGDANDGPCKELDGDVNEDSQDNVWKEHEALVDDESRKAEGNLYEDFEDEEYRKAGIEYNESRDDEHTDIVCQELEGGVSDNGRGNDSEKDGNIACETLQSSKENETVVGNDDNVYVVDEKRDQNVDEVEVDGKVAESKNLSAIHNGDEMIAPCEEKGSNNDTQYRSTEKQDPDKLTEVACAEVSDQFVCKEGDKESGLSLVGEEGMENFETNGIDIPMDQMIDDQREVDGQQGNSENMLGSGVINGDEDKVNDEIDQEKGEELQELLGETLVDSLNCGPDIGNQTTEILPTEENIDKEAEIDKEGAIHSQIKSQYDEVNMKNVDEAQFVETDSTHHAEMQGESEREDNEELEATTCVENEKCVELVDGVTKSEKIESVWQTSGLDIGSNEFNNRAIVNVDHDNEQSECFTVQTAKTGPGEGESCTEQIQEDSNDKVLELSEVVNDTLVAGDVDEHLEIQRGLEIVDKNEVIETGRIEHVSIIEQMPPEDGKENNKLYMRIAAFEDRIREGQARNELITAVQYVKIKDDQDPVKLPLETIHNEQGGGVLCGAIQNDANPCEEKKSKILGPGGEKNNANTNKEQQAGPSSKQVKITEEETDTQEINTHCTVDTESTGNEEAKVGTSETYCSDESERNVKNGTEELSKETVADDGCDFEQSKEEEETAIRLAISQGDVDQQYNDHGQAILTTEAAALEVNDDVDKLVDDQTDDFVVQSGSVVQYGNEGIEENQDETVVEQQEYKVKTAPPRYFSSLLITDAKSPGKEHTYGSTSTHDESFEMEDAHGDLPLSFEPVENAYFKFQRSDCREEFNSYRPRAFDQDNWPSHSDYSKECSPDDDIASSDDPFKADGKSSQDSSQSTLNQTIYEANNGSCQLAPDSQLVPDEIDCIGGIYDNELEKEQAAATLSGSGCGECVTDHILPSQQQQTCLTDMEAAEVSETLAYCPVDSRLSDHSREQKGFADNGECYRETSQEIGAEDAPKEENTDLPECQQPYVKTDGIELESKDEAAHEKHLIPNVIILDNKPVEELNYVEDGTTTLGNLISNGDECLVLPVHKNEENVMKSERIEDDHDGEACTQSDTELVTNTRYDSNEERSNFALTEDVCHVPTPTKTECLPVIDIDAESNLLNSKSDQTPDELTIETPLLCSDIQDENVEHVASTVEAEEPLLDSNSATENVQVPCESRIGNEEEVAIELVSSTDENVDVSEGESDKSAKENETTNLPGEEKPEEILELIEEALSGHAGLADHEIDGEEYVHIDEERASTHVSPETRHTLSKDEHDSFAKSAPVDTDMKIKDFDTSMKYEHHERVLPSGSEGHPLSDTVSQGPQPELPSTTESGDLTYKDLEETKWQKKSKKDTSPAKVDVVEVKKIDAPSSSKNKPLWRKVVARLQHPRSHKRSSGTGKLRKRLTSDDIPSSTQPLVTHEDSRENCDQEEMNDDGWKTLDRDSVPLKKRPSQNKTPGNKHDWRRFRRLRRMRYGAEMVPDKLPATRRPSGSRIFHTTYTGPHTSYDNPDNDDLMAGGPQERRSADGKTRKKRSDLLLHRHVKEVELTSEQNTFSETDEVFEVCCDQDRKEASDLAESLANKGTPPVRLLMKPLMSGMHAQACQQKDKDSSMDIPVAADAMRTRPSKRISCVVM